ncbi:MAG: hypothetical protein ACJ8H8_27605 [Geminicoccaceae bacterium]
MAAARTEWQETATQIDPSRLVFLDESGFDTRLARTPTPALPEASAHWAACRAGTGSV